MREWLSGILSRKKKETPTYQGLKAERAKQLEGKPWEVTVHDDDTATVNVPMKDDRGRLKGVVEVSYALHTTDEFLNSERTVDDIRDKAGNIIQITRGKPTNRMVINNQTTKRTVGQMIRDLEEDAKALGVEGPDLHKSKLIAEKALSEAYQRRKKESNVIYTKSA